MSIFARRGLGDSNSELIPSRSSGRLGSVSVSADSAMRQSAVWAALRLRADMVSTLPVDVFRKLGSELVEVAKPPVLVNPSGDGMTLREWLYSTQVDLDRVGNAFGLITARDGAGLPAEIQLVDHAKVTVIVRKGVLLYRIENVEYAAKDVWHERQFTLPGLVVGLSPVAYAAWSIGLFQSAQQFGLEWFANGGYIPSGHFRNTKKAFTEGQAATFKDRFKAAVENRDVIVTGDDWEYKTIDAGSSDAQFLETQKHTELDIARFFGVPGDLIEAQGNASSVTYANVTQRNLQFLVMNLQPTLTRREDALSKLVAAPRFVKFNTDAILRMDPLTKAQAISLQLDNRTMTPSEARALENKAPLTDAQWAEFDHLPSKTSTIGAAV